MIGQVEELGLKSETDIVALNCEALCAVTRMVLPYMECNSRIIQYASSAAFLPQPGFAIYAATKSFVLSYSRALNQELRGHETGNTCGVDSETFGTIESRMETACSLRDLTGAVVVMTGVEDVVAGKEKKFIVRNGHPWMARITGSGCMLDGLMGAFCGLYEEPGLAGLTEEAAVTALSAHGLCGELAAAETAKRGGGTGTFRMYLLDKMSLLDDGTLERGKKIEIR